MVQKLCAPLDKALAASAGTDGRVFRFPSGFLWPCVQLSASSSSGPQFPAPSSRTTSLPTPENSRPTIQHLQRPFLQIKRPQVTRDTCRRSRGDASDRRAEKETMRQRSEPMLGGNRQNSAADAQVRRTPVRKPGKGCSPCPWLLTGQPCVSLQWESLVSILRDFGTVPYLTPDINPTVGANHDHGRRSQA